MRHTSGPAAGGRRRVVLLGATGSIGRQCCDVIDRFPDRFELVGVVAGSDATGLQEVMRRLRVGRGALATAPAGQRCPDGVGAGMDAACEIAAMESDVVCVAIPGAAALSPTLAALDAGRTIATATKEVLVMAGELVRDRARSRGARILPVDSEHSALWQCLRGERPTSVRRLVLTASGGPFREREPGTFATISVAEALRHPTWSMGPKVTIDSATMMNKGLEIIEAHFLFDVPYSRVGVLIHPPSIVHSMVEFVDGATIAQLGVPDMRVPIALAIADGERLPDIAPPVQLTDTSSLAFFEVDDARFPAVALARSAGETGGVAPAVLNAANEIAVAAFLDHRLRFDEIVPLVAETVGAAPPTAAPSVADILEADAWARQHAGEQVGAATGARA
ncbi:MAG: 1-deoxy-D-xylulose-5-phosphate reductoisomerase [Candidatus Dormibacteraeota bacterium]|uniref:1-deoxy-D-xylulose 5-phosphate reductoisomerase n=1 Tax=Candidatus Amunia macphersoniae TaxID=3127014 RepID=A0A934KSB8_9BACT|nr:1-deoxy-D-xylulose-5-phosphate reductoisomerase [Candidatus Dormibacteraeota bacterium]